MTDREGVAIDLSHVQPPMLADAGAIDHEDNPDQSGTRATPE